MQDGECNIYAKVSHANVSTPKSTVVWSERSSPLIVSEKHTPYQKKIFDYSVTIYIALYHTHFKVS